MLQTCSASVFFSGDQTTAKAEPDVSSDAVSSVCNATFLSVDTRRPAQEENFWLSCFELKPCFWLSVRSW